MSSVSSSYVITLLLQVCVILVCVCVVPMCARGIACMGNSVCIGTSDGTILVFTISEEKGVEYRQQLGSSKGSSHPISCLAISDDGRLASGDESGRVIIWRDPSRTSDIMSQNTIGKYVTPWLAMGPLFI